MAKKAKLAKTRAKPARSADRVTVHNLRPGDRWDPVKGCWVNEKSAKAFDRKLTAALKENLPRRRSGLPAGALDELQRVHNMIEGCASNLIQMFECVQNLRNGRY